MKMQNKLLGLAKNYLNHLLVPGPNQIVQPTYPLVFSKPWSTLVYNPQKELRIKRHTNRVIFHEVELGIVISKEATNINKQDYMDYIAGYFLVLDFTDKELLMLDLKSSGPWFLSKAFDNFCPLGEFISKDQITDPHDVDLELKINGEVRQKDNTKNMFFKIGDMMQYITQYSTLYPGDLIMTGTPNGINEIKFDDLLESSLSFKGQCLCRLDFHLRELI